MGWRAWNAYEQEAHERWRALPWRERYPLRVVARLAAFLIVAAAILYAAVASSAPIDSADIRVIDGDTIRVYQKRTDVRLVGFNAPETPRQMRGRAHAWWQGNASAAATGANRQQS